MSIVCPLCTEYEVRFKHWKEYAHHILKEHKDSTRAVWAADALAAENETIVEAVKYKGKPVEQVPVARRDTLPPLVRRELERQDREHKVQVQEENIEKPKRAKGRSKPDNAPSCQE
jgi:hypothetical protein